MKNIILSVITPVLNSEEFIESCIKNVIEQNCLQAEHIIVDGGSIDCTVKIVEQYVKNISTSNQILQIFKNLPEPSLLVGNSKVLVSQ